MLIISFFCVRWSQKLIPMTPPNRYVLKTYLWMRCLTACVKLSEIMRTCMRRMHCPVWVLNPMKPDINDDDDGDHDDDDKDEACCM